ncbi:3-hydroxyisobutyrate dehydrogenase [Modicisalibacter muralis]|uniref:3-hydroxyisobutyrate dehydrogenase n=1 Tax=Modicisalibacter muralis TaxID=119000 RepID=A0A1G9LL35_9GAMM|nr:NAD(P)-binding domain-containing protein [Halomonas muralis]SDL62692.1 3-hydroxyisobutyrate dehydrogenase [Halomonas muralis]
MAEPTSVGVIGTGQIGSRIAKRLLRAGYRVVIHDIDPAAMEGIPGALPVDSAAAVARDCDLVITCVTDHHSVRDVVIGRGGILEAVRPEHLVIETTTSTPATTREVTAALRGHGADLVDAPVSRGVPAAEKGTLSIMLGGDEAPRERAQPVLQQLGTEIIATGEVGTGHIAKAMNMMVMAVNFTATMELMHVADSHGISREKSIARFASGPARSFVLDHHWPRYILPATYDSGFTLGLMWKDLRIASEIAVGSGQAPLLGERVTSLYRWAATAGMAESDNTQLVKFTDEIRTPRPSGQHRSIEAESLLECLEKALFAAVYLGTLEALAVARAAGLEPERLLAVLNASSGGSAVSRGEHGGSVNLEPLYANAREAALIAMEQGNSSFVTGLVPQILGLGLRVLSRTAPDDAVIDFICRRMETGDGSRGAGPRRNG